MLTTVACAEQDHEVMGVISRMFVEMMRTPAGRGLVLDVLPLSELRNRTGH
ncbi:hypothetical protein [Streptomyces sp. NPDC059757]|uniref:hypothetical protein n=1 Tax=Streptomyces sp. NPDC059757 TaxID=3346935 RepID=UPI0036653FCB